MKDIIKALKSQTNLSDELTIKFESSPEEAAIIGTKQAYINAAIKLLEIANSSQECQLDTDIIESSEVRYTNSIKQVFSEHGMVWPIVAYVTSSNNETSEVSKYFES